MKTITGLEDWIEGMLSAEVEKLKNMARYISENLGNKKETRKDISDYKNIKPTKYTASNLKTRHLTRLVTYPSSSFSPSFS